MIITLKHEATCRDCGAKLPAGTRARWYRSGAVYGLDCHERTDTQPRRRRGRRAQPPPAGSRYYDSYADSEPLGQTLSRMDPRGVYTPDGRRVGTFGPRCEDAPCCGCCS